MRQSENLTSLQCECSIKAVATCLYLNLLSISEFPNVQVQEFITVSTKCWHPYSFILCRSLCILVLLSWTFAASPDLVPPESQRMTEFIIILHSPQNWTEVSLRDFHLYAAVHTIRSNEGALRWIQVSCAWGPMNEQLNPAARAKRLPFFPQLCMPHHCDGVGVTVNYLEGFHGLQTVCEQSYYFSQRILITFSEVPISISEIKDYPKQWFIPTVPKNKISRNTANIQYFTVAIRPTLPRHSGMLKDLCITQELQVIILGCRTNMLLSKTKAISWEGEERKGKLKNLLVTKL